MSEGIKDIFERYQPKTYRSKPAIKRAVRVPDHCFMGWSIPTLEGTMIAGAGDYVIEGINGEYYPCKADIFHKSYEAIE